jgi:proline iminopeptidase
LVTHYVRHNAFLEDGILLRNVEVLAGIPAVLITGRFDLQAPIGNAWELHRAWPGSELVVVEGAGHLGSAATRDHVLGALDRFSRR